MISKQKTIIFDMDGVITNTEPLKAEAHVATVRYFGGNAPIELYTQVIGESQEIVSGVFIKLGGIKCETDTYSMVFQKFYCELLDKKLQFTLGMPNFLHFLDSSNYVLGLVSSSSLATINKILQRLEIRSCFKRIISANDVKKMKPSPEPYLLALQHLGATSNKTIVFEDSEAGIISARTAGFSVIAVKHTFNRLHQLSKAAYVINSFENTLSILDMINNLFSKGQSRKEGDS